MRYYWNLNAGKIVQSTGSESPLTSVSIMRSAGDPVELQFLRDTGSGLVPVLAADFGTSAGAMIAEVKKTAQFDGASLIPVASFVEDSVNKLYTAYLNYINGPLDALFVVDGDNTNDVGTFTGQLGFGYTPSGSVLVPSQNLILTVTNNAARGDGGGAVPTPTFADMLAIYSQFCLPSAVADYTGGGSTKLDGWQTTLGRSKPRNYFFIHPTDGKRNYLMRAGTEATDAPFIVRPTDYASGTNETVYVLQP